MSLPTFGIEKIFNLPYKKEDFKIVSHAPLNMPVIPEAHKHDQRWYATTHPEELALMVKFGLTPLQALQASVINSPAYLHKTNYGAIAAGKKADILLLDANPVADIHNTQKINALVVKGKLLDRAALDQLLQEVKEKTALTK